MRLTAILAVIVLVASVSSAEIFVASRQAAYGHDSDMQLTNYGNAGSIRLKGGISYGGALWDWNAQAIMAFIGANPISDYTATLYFKEVVDGGWGAGDVNCDVYASKIRDEWDANTGGGGYGGADFNWTERGPAATVQYASTYYDTVGVTKTLGADSVRWFTLTGSSGDLRQSGLRGIKNSTYAVGNAAKMGEYISVVLDEAMLVDLLTNETNRGLFVSSGGNWDLNQVYGLGSAGNQPYLDIVPEPATLSVLAVGGLMALIRRRR